MIYVALIIALVLGIAALVAGSIGQIGLSIVFTLSAAVVLVSILGKAGGSNPHLVEEVPKSKLRMVKK